MLRWFLSLWDRLDRNSDVKNLWPACKKHHGDIDAARSSFYFYLLDKQEWTDHYSDAEIKAFVETCS